MPSHSIRKADKQKTDRFSEHLLNGAMAPTQLFPTSFHTVITLMSSMDSLLNASSTTSNNRKLKANIIVYSASNQLFFFFFFCIEVNLLTWVFLRIFKNCICSKNIHLIIISNVHSFTSWFVLFFFLNFDSICFLALLTTIPSFKIFHILLVFLFLSLRILPHIIR